MDGPHGSILHLAGAQFEQVRCLVHFVFCIKDPVIRLGLIKRPVHLPEETHGKNVILPLPSLSCHGEVLIRLEPWADSSMPEVHSACSSSPALPLSTGSLLQLLTHGPRRLERGRSSPLSIKNSARIRSNSCYKEINALPGQGKETILKGLLHVLRYIQPVSFNSTLRLWGLGLLTTVRSFDF